MAITTLAKSRIDGVIAFVRQNFTDHANIFSHANTGHGISREAITQARMLMLVKQAIAFEEGTTLTLDVDDAWEFFTKEMQYPADSFHGNLDIVSWVFNRRRMDSKFIEVNHSDSDVWTASVADPDETYLPNFGHISDSEALWRTNVHYQGNLANSDAGKLQFVVDWLITETPKAQMNFNHFMAHIQRGSQVFYAYAHNLLAMAFVPSNRSDAQKWASIRDGMVSYADFVKFINDADMQVLLGEINDFLGGNKVYLWIPSEKSIETIAERGETVDQSFLSAARTPNFATARSHYFVREALGRPHPRSVSDSGITNVIFRGSDNSILTLSPAFETHIYDYTATVPNSVDSVSSFTSARQSLTKIERNQKEDLEVGENTITITAIGEDGDSKSVYTFVITREASE